MPKVQKVQPHRDDPPYDYQANKLLRDAILEPAVEEDPNQRPEEYPYVPEPLETPCAPNHDLITEVVKLRTELHDLQEFTQSQLQEFSAAIQILGNQLGDMQNKVRDLQPQPQDSAFVPRSCYVGLEPAQVFQAVLVGAMTSQAKQIGLNAANAMRKHRSSSLPDQEKSLMSHYAEAVWDLAEFVYSKYLDRNKAA